MNKRLEQLSRFLPADDTAALITARHHVQYLTGYPSADGYVLITKERGYFLTDFRCIELARRTVTGAECRLMTRLSEALSELAKKHGLRKILLESSEVTMAFVKRLEQQVSGVSFDATDALDGELVAMREVKDEDEIRAIRQAQAITEESFAHIVSHIREGMTEREIALELEFYMRKRGAERVAFDCIVVAGENTAIPHGVPTDRPIRRGDFITMDFGAVVSGYHSDMTRTVAVGAVSDEQKHVYHTVLDAQLAALAVLRDGLPCKDGDAAARSVIETAGYGAFFGHATGHGVGVQIHEAPRLSSAAGEELLKAGQIVTVEPGIYMDGKFGVRIEDMVLITADGCQNLTSCPKELLFIN